MGIVLLIAGKDLRQRLRDRSALVLGFVAPLVIAALMSLAFQGTEQFRFSLGIVDQDQGPVAAALIGILEDPELADVITVAPLADPVEARRQVDDGTVAAAVVVPEGFSAAATGPAPAPEGPAPLLILTSVDHPLAAQVTRAVADGFLAQVNANRLSVATAIAAGRPPGEAGRLALAAAAERLPEQVARTPIGAERLRPVSYFAPGMGIFFVLFAVGFTARSFFGERRQGTLERMAVAPVSRNAILAGKALSVFAYAVASLSTVALVTTLAFGADWGHPAAAAIVIVAMALSVVALTALVIVLARTERQAEGLASVAVFTLALLGGNFVFVSAAPPIMRRLALGTPNGWALRAFTDLATTGGGLGHDLSLIAGPLMGILAFTAVALAATAALSRRLVLR